MDRLNYFTPYISKGSYHEDQLTRAFLVILRYVPLAQASFFDLIREVQLENKSEQIIPPLSDLGSQITTIETQVQTIKQHKGRLVSIIMTNENWVASGFVEASQRGARYDGVIYYAPEWVLVIENKPNFCNIWEEQLNPNISEGSEIRIDPKPVCLNWRKVIERFSSLIERQLVQGAEALLINDFLYFVDQKFSYLNPYTSFGICKDNRYLLERRCISVMEKIAPSKVKYHRGWTSFIEIEGTARMIALYPEVLENGEWKVFLSMAPGDTVTQAKEFFYRLQKEEFFALQGKGWKISPNLHFSFMATNLVWAATKESVEEYINYWRAKKKPISQVQRNNFITLFQELKNECLISEEDVSKLEENFINSKRQTLNLCPGLKLEFSWSKSKAIELDSKGHFEEEVKLRIHEAIGTWGQQLEF